MVHAYQDSILRLAYAYLKNHSDAEDIAQEVFIQYVKKHPCFDLEVKKKAWLIKVTANMCRNVIKSAWRKRVDLVQDDLDDLPTEQFELLTLVLSLDEKYRIPIHLHYYEGYAIIEIAELLGAKAATVGTWLSRGRGVIKAMMGDDFFD
jgi:RNA polymerase sigma-70 factor (ECF subfamily)